MGPKGLPKRRQLPLFAAFNLEDQSSHLRRGEKGKVHPCTGTEEALYRPYGP